MGYEELVAQVQRLLGDAIKARFRGDLHVNKVKDQAYADGYMRALLDAGLIDHRELLELIAKTRRSFETESKPLDIAIAS